ncbi:MAG: hypothetical protein ACKVQU_01705 [Burkholderiales bacterium]
MNLHYLSNALSNALFAFALLAGGIAWSNEGMVPVGESARGPIPDFVIRKTDLACVAKQSPEPSLPIGCVID